MLWSRRDFISHSALAAGALVVPKPARTRWRPGGVSPDANPLIDASDPRLADLAAHALDAARRGGATYADVRLTYVRTGRYTPGYVINSRQNLHIGVRALRSGYWGFASSPFWSPDAAAYLGASAAAFAQDNAQGPSRPLALAPSPVIANGKWQQPVSIDPFEISVEEIFDWIHGTMSYMQALGNARGFPGSLDSPAATYANIQLARRVEHFASTEGSQCTQTFTDTGLSLLVNGLTKNETFPAPGGNFVARGGDATYLLESHQLLPTALRTDAGWAPIRAIPLRTLVELVYDEMEENLKLPAKMIDVGRYTAVLDWASMASLLNATLGQATELDRAMGYEANANGTSYLGPDPMRFLDTLIAAPSVSVTANNAASVQWDAEGVTPKEFTLVKEGSLVDYQTTRESASWLAEYYGAKQRLVQSHGCAGADTASNLTMAHQPNLRLTPGTRSLNVNDLIAQVPRGIYVENANVFGLDHQALNGFLGNTSSGGMYEIKNGKKVARISGATAMFRSPELWKSVLAVGGAASLRRADGTSRKGEPAQSTTCRVEAVPAVVKDLTLIDITRRV